MKHIEKLHEMAEEIDDEVPRRVFNNLKIHSFHSADKHFHENKKHGHCKL